MGTRCLDYIINGNANANSVYEGHLKSKGSTESDVGHYNC